MRSLQPLQFIDAIARAGSIRKAAESLAITSSALNRRLLALEEQLAVQVFERQPQGVRLSTAGELLVHHLRTQAADFEKLKSQLADLKGQRRGHISIGCSQAFLPYFLPEQIGLYRQLHPGVTFSVKLRDRAAAEDSLIDHSTDIALIFEPIRFSEVRVIATVPQQIHAVMSSNHPLSGKEVLRLRDCAEYDIALPDAFYGVRQLIDPALARASVEFRTVVEADSFDFLRYYPLQENIISFQIPLGLPRTQMSGVAEAIVSRPIDPRDVPAGRIYLCQLRSRILPVAAAKFAALIEREFDAMAQ